MEALQKLTQSPPPLSQSQPEVKQTSVCAVTIRLSYFLDVTLPLLTERGITTRPPSTSVAPSHLTSSLFFFLNLLLVLSQVFCTPFLCFGANPTQDRPLLVVLLFSDVSECAPDLRGRSHVGHALTLEFVFLSSIILFLWFLLPSQIRGFIWSAFILKERLRLHVVYFIFYVGGILHICFLTVVYLSRLFTFL